MANESGNPLAPRTRPPYYAGTPIEFAGYVDDFDRAICAMEFSLDDGASWTAYPTAAVDKSRGVNWRFVYTPETPGRYLLKVRPVTEDGEPSALVAGFAFEALPAGGTFGDARIRAVGGSFKDARIFRSRELSNLTARRLPSFLRPSASPPFTTCARPPRWRRTRSPTSWACAPWPWSPPLSIAVRIPTSA